MKPTTLFAALLCCTASMAHAQKMTKDAKYRRSSLYTMMIEDRKMTGGAEAIVVNTFSKMPTPDKYDDHCVGARIAEIDGLTISEADLKAAAELTGKGTKKGLGGLMKAAGKQVAAPEEKGKLSDNEYIARLMKYFEQNHTANKMIAKWYGVEDLNQAHTYQFGFKLIKERGLQNASKEDLDKATLVKGGVDKIVSAAALELIPNTFVMVTRYSYLPAEELMAQISAYTNAIGSYLGGIGSLAGTATSLAGSTLKGYFVKTTSYLFQLDWDKETQDAFEMAYADQSPQKLIDEGKYRLKYVGKTWDYAPATLKVTLNNNHDSRLIERATVRATDGAMAKLQKKYDVFKTMSPLHIKGDQIIAYIGKKEGLKGGEKFDVFELIQKEDGTTEYKKTGDITAIKGKVWDNRYGTDIQSEDAASDGDEKADTDEQLEYTLFKGNAKKLMDGMLIRQAK